MTVATPHYVGKILQTFSEGIHSDEKPLATGTFQQAHQTEIQITVLAAKLSDI